MPQHGVCDRLDVIGQYLIAPLQPGVGAGAAIQADGAARAGPDVQPAGQLFVIALGVAGREDQVHHVLLDHCVDLDPPNFCAGRKNGLLWYRVGRTGLALFLAPHQPDDLGFVCLGAVVDVYMHQEAVHLRFGQGVGPLLFHRVLRRHDDEQVGQFVRGAGHGHLALLHGFQQRGLDLGRCAVDLIRQHDIGEDGARFEAEGVLPALSVQDLRSGDIGRQQIRCELDAGKLGFQCLGHAFHRARFGQAGQAFHENVAVGQEANDQPFYHLLLADDGFPHSGLQIRNSLQSGHCSPLDHVVQILAKKNGGGLRPPPLVKA